MQLLKFISWFSVFFVLSLISLISLSYATPNDAELIKVNISHEIDFKINEKTDSRFNYLNVYSYYIPQTIGDYQILKSYSTTFPGEVFFSSKKEVPRVEYTFSKENIQRDINFETNFEVLSSPYHPRITSKASFPYSPKELTNYDEFLDFTEQININKDLKQKAFDLAGNEDDVYVIATVIANWVQDEIEYDLSTVFLNPDQKATEIFESKKGVCKELSILYASMLRSLNIPTRMVMGYAYTNSEDVIDLVGSNWGGHAWVEVYIDGEWVPFDLTYQQYGFVDASHIALQHTSDITQLGVQLELSAYNIDIVKNSLLSSFDFEQLGEQGTFNVIDITTELTSDFEEYAPNSYVEIKAIIENPQEYYQAVPLQIFYPKEVKVVDDDQLIILEPRSIKEVSFIAQMPNLEGFIFPFSLYSQDKELAKRSITLVSNAPFVDENSIKADDSVSIPQTTSVSNQQFEESLIGNISYNCEFNTNKEGLYLDCDFNKEGVGSQVDFFELCSVIECVEYNNFEFNKLVSIKTEFNSQYTLQIDEKIIPLKINYSIPSIDYTYRLDKEEFTFESLILEEDPHFRIEFKSGAYSLDVDYYQPISSLNLPPGDYTGIVYYYYLDSLILTEVITFRIEKKTFIDNLASFFRDLFS